MLRFNDGAWEECGRSWAQEQESKRMGVSMIDLKSWCESSHWEELLRCYMDADNQLPPECIGFSSGKLVESK